MRAADDTWWCCLCFFCFQLYTCWCTMSFSSCLCGRTGKPSSPSPWTPWRRWVCLTSTPRYCRPGWRGLVGSADVGYSLAAWLNAAFRLIILSSESAWSCTVMAVILTTALLLCSPNGHTCTDLKKKKKEPPLHISSNCGEAWTQSIIHMKAFLYETWSMDHLRFFRL